MDTTTSTVAAVVIATVGQWSKKDGKLSVKIVVGMMVLVLFMSAVDSANEEFAKKLAGLILVTSIFANFVPISRKLGFSR